MTQRQLPTIQKIPKTVEIPQAQFMETNRCCRDSAAHPEEPEDFRDTTGAAVGHARCDTRQALGLPQVQHTGSVVDRVVNLPVAVRDHVCMVQTAQYTVEVPQGHYMDS